MRQFNRFGQVQWPVVIVVVTTVLNVFATTPAMAEPADDIRFVKDLAYRPDGKTQYERERCKLDLYLPTECEGFATIVWFHGGSIQAGDKACKIAVDFGRRFAGDGIAVASVNYRLHPEVKYPAYHAGSDAPPSLNIVGGQDLPARAEENRYFVAAMKAAGHKDVTYLEVEGRNHATVASRVGEADDPVAKAMIAFVERLRP